MNTNDSGALLTFHLTPPAGQKSHLQEQKQQGQMYCKQWDSQWWYLLTLVILFLSAATIMCPWHDLRAGTALVWLPTGVQGWVRKHKIMHVTNNNLLNGMVAILCLIIIIKLIILKWLKVVTVFLKTGSTIGCCFVTCGLSSWCRCVKQQQCYHNNIGHHRQMRKAKDNTDSTLQNFTWIWSKFIVYTGYIYKSWNHGRAKTEKNKH